LASFQSTSVPFIHTLPLPGNAMLLLKDAASKDAASKDAAYVPRL
jgi:hypothetical protein